MSIEALAIALNHSQSRGTAKVVLLGIANHDGDAGSFPKVATLAKYANVHPRRVQEAIATLTALGEISVETKQGGMRDIPDHLRPNLYRFLLACPPECDGSSQHRVSGHKVARSRKGTAGYVDNRPRTGDENSTGDENVSTKNHHVEPSSESAGLGFGSTSPAGAESSCWACGNPQPGTGRYCQQCISTGLDNPMISCRYDGCDMGVRPRTFPGEQSYDCGDHSEGVVD